MKQIEQLRYLNILKVFRLFRFDKQTIFFLAIILFLGANVLLVPFALRLDLSKGRAYTLSSSTKKILKNIDKSVTINFYASSDLPTKLLPLKREVTDLLNEYKKSGGTKVHLNILDPKKDANALSKAKTDSIPELQFSQVEKDKYAVTTAYFGIAIIKDEKKELLPQVTEPESLEYNLTAAIYKLTRKDTAKIGFIGLPEIPDPQQDPVATLRRLLAQQFEISTVNVSSASADNKIDQSVKSVLVFDTGAKEYDSQEIESIKQYLSAGGKGLFFTDGVWVQADLTTTDAKHNLSAILSDWGVSIDKNFVLSASSEVVNFGNELVSYFVPYPFWVKTSNFDTKSSFFSNINQLTYPWTSSISVGKKSNITTNAIVRTTKQSWEQTNTFLLHPQNIPQPTQKDLKDFVITAHAKNKSGGAIAVVPSSRFAADRYLSRGSDNLEFILNIVNEFASGGALSGIRQRVVTFSPLPDLPENQKDIFKYTTILLLPALFGVLGAVRLMKRK